MLRSLCATLSLKPIDHGRLLFMLHPRRNMHSRNKTAMELIAKGWSALKEVDRVIDYCELNDRRLLPLLRVSPDFSGSMVFNARCNSAFSFRFL
ncbi:hypothetical protein EUGRSUZ_L03701 [Eucalyptus grandis]|uniref:Uncharacterized protein n=1 Tax=Eucalyptus grandis TaxID=71139 RepID=A0AAD9WGL5_EUCGR|nr:hypothetical protein EUGRSUZ_L03701 [Eucalyptus grandis]